MTNLKNLSLIPLFFSLIDFCLSLPHPPPRVRLIIFLGSLINFKALLYNGLSTKNFKTAFFVQILEALAASSSYSTSPLLCTVFIYFPPSWLSSSWKKVEMGLTMKGYSLNPRAPMIFGLLCFSYKPCISWLLKVVVLVLLQLPAVKERERGQVVRERKKLIVRKKEMQWSHEDENESFRDEKKERSRCPRKSLVVFFFFQHQICMWGLVWGVTDKRIARF